MASAATRPWTPDDVEKVLLDPRYAGALGYPAIIDQEAWIKANVRLMQEKGVASYCASLVALLRDVDADTAAWIEANPPRVGVPREAFLARVLEVLRRPADEGRA